MFYGELISHLKSENSQNDRAIKQPTSKQQKQNVAGPTCIDKWQMTLLTNDPDTSESSRKVLSLNSVMEPSGGA